MMAWPLTCPSLFRGADGMALDSVVKSYGKFKNVNSSLSLPSLFTNLFFKPLSFSMTSFTSIEANRFIHQLIRLGFEKKFENNLAKVKNGEEVTFFKPYDRKAFDLSKFVWTVKFSGKSKKSRKLVTSSPNGRNCKDEVVTTNKGETSSLVELDEFVKFVLVKSVDRFVNKKIFEKQWKVLQLRELEFYSLKSGFIHEVIRKMAETF
ncbi:unnamed protein product [Brassica oleracea var. botrytis]